MAFGTNVGLDVSLQTNQNLSAKQFYFVKLNSSKYAVLAGANDRALGVLQDDTDGSSTAKACEVRYGGVSKVACGGTFSAGDLIASNASGQAVKYTGATVFTGTPYTVSGSQVLGIALEAGASGQISSMIFHPSGYAA